MIAISTSPSSTLQRQVEQTPALQEPALIARLLLVHAWRDVLLRDPRLPAACLPQDWPGPQARTLFVTLYTALTPAAEAHIAAHSEGEDGLLPARTDLSQRRLPHF